MENEKTTIICGVYHEMTEEEKNNLNWNTKLK
jgi:hypothetical protein